MATSSALILIAGMAAVTYLTRLPLYFLTIRGRDLPPLVDEILARIPTAAFAAIVFPGVIQPDGHTQLDWSNLYLYAAALCVATVALTRRNLLATIAVGIVAATLLRQFAA